MTDTPTLTPFKPEPKRLWVEALRSDRFVQARGSFVSLMRIDDEQHTGHCCLAVATAVAIENGVRTVRKTEDSMTRYEKLEFCTWETSTWDEATDDADVDNLENWVEWDDYGDDPGDGDTAPHRPTDPPIYRWKEEEEALPAGVQAWLGAEDANPILEGPGGAAITLNDQREWTYAQIADAIETNR